MIKDTYAFNFCGDPRSAAFCDSFWYNFFNKVEVAGLEGGIGGLRCPSSVQSTCHDECKEMIFNKPKRVDSVNYIST